MRKPTCRYCGRPDPMPCMSTRDMEDRAMTRDTACLKALEEHGGGEIGAGRIRLRLDSPARTTTEGDE